MHGPSAKISKRNVKRHVVLSTMFHQLSQNVFCQKKLSRYPRVQSQRKTFLSTALLPLLYQHKRFRCPHCFQPSTGSYFSRPNSISITEVFHRAAPSMCDRRNNGKALAWGISFYLHHFSLNLLPILHHFSLNFLTSRTSWKMPSAPDCVCQ